MAWEVLETAREVALESDHVRIDDHALSLFAEDLLQRRFLVPTWDPRYHYVDGTAATVAYLLVLDTVNFCFWPLPGQTRWEIAWGSEILSGYFGVAAALKRAFESGGPVRNARSLAVLQMDSLQKIFSGNGSLQLLNERLHALRELGAVLLDSYQGKASHLVEAASGSALDLARLLARELSSFRDTARYKGKEVLFYKRAQLFAADLWGAFHGTRWGRFTDMDRLTAFADYKLPQVLCRLGILHYAAPLQEKVDRMERIEGGSPEEVEIRANTIWAVHRIGEELRRQGKEIRDFELDWLLWHLGQEDRWRERPYHRTVSIFY
jgi:hypothetical protein